MHNLGIRLPRKLTAFHERRSSQFQPPIPPNIPSSSQSPNQHRNNDPGNSENLHPSNDRLLDTTLKELLHGIRIICSWERLIWNGTIEDLAKWFPPLFDIEKVEFLCCDDTADVCFVDIEKFCGIWLQRREKGAKRREEDLLGPNIPSGFW